MKTLLRIAALAMLATTSPLALAQQSTTPETTTPEMKPTPPAGDAVTPEVKPAAPSESGTAAPAPSTGTTAAVTGTYYQHQAGEMRASKLIGMTVRNAAGDSIGDINEIVLAPDGKVAAVIIGVGGFLGMGEREVALPFEQVKVTTDANGSTVATADATKEGLSNAPAWTWTQEKSESTGANPDAPQRSPAQPQQ